MVCHNQSGYYYVTTNSQATFSDVMMPKMDGPALVRQFREERKTRFLPVIFVTASDDGAYLSG